MTMSTSDERTSQLLSIAAAAVVLAEKMIRTTKVDTESSRPAREWKVFCVCGFVVWQVELMRSLLDLARNGHYDVGQTISRTMVEGMIKVVWLMEDPDTRLDQWGSYLAVEQYAHAREMEGELPADPEWMATRLARLRKQVAEQSYELLTDEARAALDADRPLPKKLTKPRAEWGGKPVAHMIDEVADDSFLWKSMVYKVQSMGIHWSPLFVIGLLPDRVLDVAQLRMNDPEHGRAALHAGVVALVVTLDEFDDACEYTKDIGELVDRLKSVDAQA